VKEKAPPTPVCAVVTWVDDPSGLARLMSTEVPAAGVPVANDRPPLKASAVPGGNAVVEALDRVTVASLSATVTVAVAWDAPTLAVPAYEAV
jgi:hypothetical protein